MAITVTKQKVKAKAAETNVIGTLAQGYAEKRYALAAKLAKLAALQKEVASMEKELLDYADTLVKADEGTEITAGKFIVKIGPKGQKAVAFDKALIKQEVGAETYEAIAEFSIENLRKYMTGDMFAKAVKYEHVNKRKVTIEEAKDA